MVKLSPQKSPAETGRMVSQLHILADFGAEVIKVQSRKTARGADLILRDILIPGTAVS